LPAALRLPGLVSRTNKNVTPEIQIVKADLSDTHHQDAILAMMDAYSKDPMGKFGLARAVYAAHVQGGGSIYMVKPLT
jgi:hypothetical protein